MSPITPVSETATTVTVNRADWEAILDRLDDRQDREAIARSESIPPDYRVTYTADETRRMVLDGVSPITIWRERRKMTQGDLAAGAGISKSYLSEIESRKKPGSTVALQRVARTLNVRIEDIIN